MNEVARNIKYHRDRMGLSQEELAGRLNTTRQTISNWERSKSNPSIDDLIALSKVFQVTVDELIYPRREQSQRFLGSNPAGTVFQILFVLVIVRLVWCKFMGWWHFSDPIWGVLFDVIAVLGLLILGCTRWIILELRKR